MMGMEAAVEEMEEMMEEEESRTRVTGAEYASSSCCRALGRWDTSSTCFVLLLLLLLLASLSFSSSSNAFIIFSCRTTSRAGNRVVKTVMQGFEFETRFYSLVESEVTDKPWSHNHQEIQYKFITVPTLPSRISVFIVFTTLPSW